MSDLEQRIAGLSPAKRELLLRQMANAGSRTRIRPRARPERIPLTFGQRRLWLLDRLTPGLVAYNHPVALWLDGPLDVAALQASVQGLVDRHEALRSMYGDERGEPFQRILERADVPFESRDASGADRAARDADALERVRSDAMVPFDLARAPMLRASLTRVDDDRHLFAIVFHHIAIDGWSIARLLTELQDGFLSRLRGQAALCAPPELQIADIAMWQRESFDGDGLKEQLDYWCGQLDGAPTVLDLPTDRPRPASATFRGARHRRRLSKVQAERIDAFGREHRATGSMVYLAAFQALLARYTGQDDIVVGMGVAGRSRIECEEVVGFFVNTLAVRARIDGERGFAALVEQVRDRVLGAIAHADAPLDRVFEAQRLARPATHTPYAQVMYFFQNHPVHAVALEGLRVAQVNVWEINPPTAQGDLTLFVEQVDGQTELVFEYATDLFDRETIEHLSGHLSNLLDAAVADAATAVARLPLVGSDEARTLADWNDRARALPQQRTLAALLQAQFERSPDAIALGFGARELGYRELDRRSNALAHALRAAGVRAGSLVGLYVERSPEMVVGLLGILKAGGAYVPLDPSYPKDRLAYMLELSDARVLVTQPSLAGALPASVDTVIEVSTDEAPGVGADDVPVFDAGPDNLAYVIFTSGSTGKPKGVEIRQQAAVNLLRSVAREPGVVAGDVVCAISTLSFDIALFELVLPLTVGARIELVDGETARDGHALRRLVDARPLTVLQATPATWRMLLDVGWTGKAGLKMISTGEALPRELAGRLLPLGAQLWNLYGPTETTVYSALCRVTDGHAAIRVGQPVDNTQIHIVDRHMQVQPIGVPGELLIGGAGLAAGYRGRPDLTAEKFIPDPFAREPGSRLYRSGDLARWRRDGSIEVIGRIDHQIKLRGFRIELGEIEAVLAQHPQVAQAIVHCREDRPGDPRLVAYVTGTTGRAAAAVLREHLKSALPDYMIPSAFVVLDAFPLTPNGKVDRRALPPADECADGDPGELLPPRDAQEQALHGLWQQLLQRQRIDVRDDFFALGGHSLLATQLISRIEQAFDVELPLRALFEAPTIEQLAVRVTDARARRDEDLEALLNNLDGLSDEEASDRLVGAASRSHGG